MCTKLSTQVDGRFKYSLVIEINMQTLGGGTPDSGLGLREAISEEVVAELSLAG